MKTNVGRYKGRALALSVLATIALSGCSLTTNSGSSGSSSSGSSSSAQASSVKVCAPKKTVGYVSINDSSPTVHRVTQTLQSATDTLGWDLKAVDGQSNFTTMQQAVQSFVNDKVDAIFVGFSDSAPLRESLQAAKDANIPVIEIGGGLESLGLYTAAYTEDEEKLGNLIGAEIVKSVPNARIADLATSLNYTGASREKGFQEAIAASNGAAQVVANQQVDMSNAAASTTQTLTAMLTANPQINAVHAVFDPMATPAASAINSLNSEAKLYTYYASESNLALMKRGDLAGVIEVDVPKTAAIAIDQVLQNAKTGAPFDPDAVEKAGGLTYTIVTSPDAQIPSDAENLAPFLTKWADEYKC